VKDVRGTIVQGLDDSLLWAVAMCEQRLLITTDKGFTEYRGRSHYGILVVRLRQPNRQKIHDRVMLAMRQLKSREWRGALVVMRDRTMSTSRSAKNL
jgi:hypothetical protein